MKAMIETYLWVENKITFIYEKNNARNEPACHNAMHAKCTRSGD